jgi:hypothetical protein
LPTSRFDQAVRAEVGHNLPMLQPHSIEQKRGAARVLKQLAEQYGGTPEELASWAELFAAGEHLD